MAPSSGIEGRLRRPETYLPSRSGPGSRRLRGGPVGGAKPLPPALPRNSPLRLATAPLARLTHLPFFLHGGLLVIPSPLDLLQDSFLRHLLLQDLQRLVDGIPNFNIKRTAAQCLQA